MSIGWYTTRPERMFVLVPSPVGTNTDAQSRQAALAELSQEYTTAEAGYETSLWLLQALLDDVMYDGGHIRDDDRISIEKGEFS